MRTFTLLAGIAVTLFVINMGCRKAENAPPGTDAQPPGSDAQAPSADAQLLATMRATVKTYIDAGLAGDQESLAEVCVPGRAVAQQATTDLPRTKGAADLELVEVLADDGTAFAVSSDIQGDRGETGVMVFTLLGSASGKWQIYDIDLEDSAGLSKERQRFTDRHPAAKVLLQTNE